MAGAAVALVPQGRAERFAPAAIVALWVVAYLNSFRAPFIVDDRYHIVENLRIRQIWPPWEILAHSSRPVFTCRWR
jgi:hypothetical protein